MGWLLALAGIALIGYVVGRRRRTDRTPRIPLLTPNPDYTPVDPLALFRAKEGKETKPL